MRSGSSIRSRGFAINLTLAIVAMLHGYIALNLFGRDTTLTLVLTAVGAVGIFLRQRNPWVSMAMALPGLFISDAVVAPLVALYTLAVRGSRLRTLLLTAALVVFGYSAVWRGYSNADFAIIITTYGLVGATGAVATGMLVRTRRELSDSIEQLRIFREEEIEQVTRDVRGAERTQLAREMHDAVSHQVSLIAVQAGALQVTSKDEEAVRAGRVIRSLAVKTIEELRQMVTVLRASGAHSQELTPQLDLSDIGRLVEGSGLEVTLKVDVSGEIPASVQRAAYRTVQEGLSNAGRYAPGAGVAVTCETIERNLVLTVVNEPSNDSPDDFPSTQHGHIGLAERAELLGGTFEAGETAEAGYQIRLVVPLA